MRSYKDKDGNILTENNIRQLHTDKSFSSPKQLGYTEIIQEFKEPINDTTKEYLETLVQRLLDNSSRSRGYDSILSECSYYGDLGKFGVEAKIAIAWRSAVWEFVGEYIEYLPSGEILDNLPKYETFAVLLTKRN